MSNLVALIEPDSLDQAWLAHWLGLSNGISANCQRVIEAQTSRISTGHKATAGLGDRFGPLESGSDRTVIVGPLRGFRSSRTLRLAVFAAIPTGGGFVPARFPLGRLLITARARDEVHPIDVVAAIRRHASGDWGELTQSDKDLNDQAVAEGARLLSAYTDRHGTRFWIITEADRSATTCLLPTDY